MQKMNNSLHFEDEGAFVEDQHDATLGVRDSGGPVELAHGPLTRFAVLVASVAWACLEIVIFFACCRLCPRCTPLCSMLV